MIVRMARRGGVVGVVAAAALLVGTLPAAAARHVQVLRLQPGDALVVFNGSDGADWPGEIVRMGRRDVDVRLGTPLPVDRELACEVTIALGVPANDRMDALVEKAGELGAAAIQTLVCERSVVRLSVERAEATAAPGARRSRSASTILAISAGNPTRGDHPSPRRAFDGSARSTSTSAGR